MRDYFFNGLYKHFDNDPRYIILTNDFGAPSLDEYRSRDSSRVINAGISEQNIISTAAGMALSGLIPIVYSISSFIISRAYEQIKIDICENLAPVTILGVGAGFAYSEDGPTHHSIDDIHLMVPLPNIEVLSPSETRSLDIILNKVTSEKKARYIRLDRYIPKDDYSNLARIYIDHGGYFYYESYTKKILITTGFMSKMVRELLNNDQEVRVSHLDLYDLTNLKQSFFSKLGEYTEIIVIDEQLSLGGVAALVLNSVANCSARTNIKTYGISKSSAMLYGARDFNQAASGIDRNSVKKIIMELSNI
jgi:transketolase